MNHEAYGIPGADFLKKIDDMLPKQLFDAHMHVSHVGFESVESSDKVLDLASYRESLLPLLPGRELFCNAITYPCDVLRDPAALNESVRFLYEQLSRDARNVGEVMVMPRDRTEDIERRIEHPGVRGLKCYWIYSESGLGDQSDIGDYLPEAAWEIANKRGLCITLHMVKSRALSDPSNLNYIKTMAKKYPSAVLILAHCARSFAAWTVFDTVDELVELENVYFDFSGIAESPAMAYIIKKVGIKRCLWGTDYPVSEFVGKPISLADAFVWITGDKLKSINTDGAIRPWRVGVESFLAFRQAVKLLDLHSGDVEDYFYNNAARLFCRR